MPYKTNADLPDPVKNALPAAAQTMFRGAFNGAMSGDPNMAEASAMKIAWAAVGKKFKKGKGGMWVMMQGDQILTDGSITSNLQFEDHFAIDASDVQAKPTVDGYYVAMPRVARSGIQIYGGKEVGHPTMDKVRVFRPPDEVFAKDSMATFVYRPMTDDHPPERVTSDNWKKYSAGQTGGEVARDGEFLRVPTILMDKALIEKFRGGKAELSVGYTCDLKWEPGVDPDSGEAYDAVQSKIRANHIAVVKAARGGDKLRIGDDEVVAADLGTPSDDGNKGEDAMSDLKKILVDGIGCEMTDTSAAIVEKYIRTTDATAEEMKKKTAAMQTEMDKTKTDSAAAISTATKTIETKDAELITVKKQLEDAKLTPAKLDALVKDRENIAGKAKAVLGAKLVTDGKTDVEIMRQLVDAKMGDAAKGWTDEQVKTSFVTLTADVKSGVNDTAHAFSGGNGHRPGPASQEIKDKAYVTYDTDLSNRWKGQKPAGAAAN